MKLKSHCFKAPSHLASPELNYQHRAHKALASFIRECTAGHNQKRLVGQFQEGGGGCRFSREKTCFHDSKMKPNEGGKRAPNQAAGSHRTSCPGLKRPPPHGRGRNRLRTLRIIPMVTPFGFIRAEQVQKSPCFTHLAVF